MECQAPCTPVPASAARSLSKCRCLCRCPMRVIVRSVASNRGMFGHQPMSPARHFRLRVRKDSDGFNHRRKSGGAFARCAGLSCSGIRLRGTALPLRWGRLIRRPGSSLAIIFSSRTRATIIQSATVCRKASDLGHGPFRFVRCQAREFRQDACLTPRLKDIPCAF